MLDPLAETVRSALELQRSQLGVVLMEARDAVQRSLPEAPSREWRGASSERYGDDLLRLRELLMRALAEAEDAYGQTGRSLVTLSTRD